MDFAGCLATIELLDDLENRSNRTGIRTDGLALAKLKGDPARQIFAWAAKQPLPSDGHMDGTKDILHYMAWAIVAAMFVSGYGISSTLLEYGGEKLVNVLSYFILLVFIPFIFSVYTAVYVVVHSRTTAQDTHSVLKLLIRLLGSVSFKNREKLQKLLLHQTLLKSLSLHYLQYGSIALSAGALLSLIITITTQDIAFGWNTTLHVTPELLGSITDTIALPWHTLLPSAVPSLELIEISHHYRLGNQISPALIAEAKTLGSWWQFLALSIITWTLLPRLFLVFLTGRNLDLTIKQAILSHPNSQSLLKQMNEIHITTHAAEENSRTEKKSHPAQPMRRNDISSQTLIGWNMDHMMLADIAKAKQITAKHIFSAGGKNTLQEDDDIISKVDTSAIIIVKAWEPPMREFLDFVKDLYDHSTKEITVFPVGTAEKGFVPEESNVDIWKAKIASLQQPRIGIYHDLL